VVLSLGQIRVVLTPFCTVRQIKKAAPDGFQYRADYPAKVLDVCIAKWHEWCAEKCGDEPGI